MEQPWWRHPYSDADQQGGSSHGAETRGPEARDDDRTRRQPGHATDLGRGVAGAQWHHRCPSARWSTQAPSRRHRLDLRRRVDRRDPDRHRPRHHRSGRGRRGRGRRGRAAKSSKSPRRRPPRPSPTSPASPSSRTAPRPATVWSNIRRADDPRIGSDARTSTTSTTRPTTSRTTTTPTRFPTTPPTSNSEKPTSTWTFSRHRVVRATRRLDSTRSAETPRR